MMVRLFLLACLLLSTACTSTVPGPKTGPPRYSFTKVQMVDVGRRTDAVLALETPIQLMNSEYAENFFSTLPRSGKLMKAYERVRDQRPDQIWLGLVSYTCLPPLAVNPRYTDGKVEFSVLTDPENELVDCVRTAPLMGIVGVTDNAVM